MAEDAAPPTPADDSVVQDALAQAQAAVNQIQGEINDTAAPADASDAPAEALPVDAEGIELLSDVDLHVMIELGRTEMVVEDVLKLNEGSVVELDKLAGDPVDVHVNGRLVARGEVLVLNDNFCIRISEIVENLEEQAAAAAAESQAAV